ncbi:unnamed protein product [Dicrocoelium dendriticum]|nr:unnamed protein product [Dicrocoelium dendriticum]
MLVKLVFPSRRSLENKEVCRLILKDRSKFATLEKLLSKIRELTSLKKTVVLKLYRKTTEGFVELQSDEDVAGAFKKQPGERCIRIYVVPCPRMNVKPLNYFFGYCTASELPDILVTSNEGTVAAVSDPWLTVPCNLCAREDWTGERFTCLYCPSIVLCPQCFYTGYHSEHPILITKNLKPFSRKLLQLSKVAAATVPWESVIRPVVKIQSKPTN